MEYKETFFKNKDTKYNNITLVDNDEIVSDDTEVAERFNCFFKNAVNKLDISENKFLLNNVNQNVIDRVEKAIDKFQIHPSILSINENVTSESKFSVDE